MKEMKKYILNTFIAFFIIFFGNTVAGAQLSRLRVVNETLPVFVGKIKDKIPREDTEKFVEPSLKERAIFANIINAVLQGNIKTAESLVVSVNYDISLLKDKKKSYVVLTEKTPRFRGLGTYIFNYNSKRNVILEVPHPLFDSYTPEEAVKIFQEIEARAIFIAGTHRCANKQESSCTGKTTACDGKSKSFKISDAGHFIRNFFHEAHKATLNLSIRPITISLHGNADATIPDIVVSDGTEVKTSDTSLVNLLRQELNKRKVKVGSCNLATDKNFDLCGTTNVQGIFSNGFKDICTVKPKSGSGLFIHIEQHINIRNDPTSLINSLKVIFPQG